jgi:hypothetical protein
MAENTDSDSYFEQAKRNMQNRVSGFAANATNAFDETHTPNGSSNDPAYLEEQTGIARTRMSRSGMGQGANSVGFFAHTGEKNKNSNDKDYVESMVDVALGRKQV